MLRLSTFAILTACLLVSACSSPPAPSEAAEKAKQQYQESTDEIEYFAVQSEEITVYHQVAKTDSMRLFQPIAVSDESPNQPMIDPFRFPAVPRLATGLERDGSLDSTFTLEDGSEVIAYTIDDPSVMLISSAPAETQDAVTKVQVLIDASTFDIRGINGTFNVPNYEQPVHEWISYNDYRDVEGVRIPHETIVRVEGLDQMFTDEQKLIMRGRIGAQRERARLLSSTEDRRKLLEQVRQQEMLIEQGAQETQFEVTDVRIGEPMPDNLQRLLDGSTVSLSAELDSTEAEPTTP